MRTTAVVQTLGLTLLAGTGSGVAQTTATDDPERWSQVSVKACRHNDPALCVGPLLLLQLQRRDGTVTVSGEDVRPGPGRTMQLVYEPAPHADRLVSPPVTVGTWVEEGAPLMVFDASWYTARYDSLTPTLAGLRHGERHWGGSLSVGGSLGDEGVKVEGGSFGITANIHFDDGALVGVTAELREIEALLLETGLESGRLTVRAPRAGWVTRYHVGEADSGRPSHVYEISDGLSGDLFLFAGQTDVALIEEGTPARIQVGDRTVAGRVQAIDDSGVAAAGSGGRYRIQVRPEAPLPQGSDPEVQLVVHEFADALFVPRAAVSRHRRLGRGVYRLEPDGSLRFIPLEFRNADESYYLVLAGLAPGDIIVGGPASAVAALASGDRLALSVHTRGVVGYGAIDEVRTIPGRVETVHVEAEQPVRRGDRLITMATPQRWIPDVRRDLSKARKGRRTFQFPAWSWKLFMSFETVVNSTAIKLLKEELAALRELEGQLVVRARRDGYIGDVSMEAGDDVFGQVALTILDILPHDLRIRIEKADAAAAGLGVGSVALVRLDAFPPDSVFHGRILTIAHRESSAVDAVVRLLEPPDGLRPGFTGMVEFELPGHPALAPETRIQRLDRIPRDAQQAFRTLADWLSDLLNRESHFRYQRRQP